MAFRSVRIGHPLPTSASAIAIWHADELRSARFSPRSCIDCFLQRTFTQEHECHCLWGGREQKSKTLTEPVSQCILAAAFSQQFWDIFWVLYDQRRLPIDRRRSQESLNLSLCAFRSRSVQWVSSQPLTRWINPKDNTNIRHTVERTAAGTERKWTVAGMSQASHVRRHNARRSILNLAFISGTSLVSPLQTEYRHRIGSTIAWLLQTVGNRFFVFFFVLRNHLLARLLPVSM